MDHQRREGVLDPSDILTDWTPAERQTLLRRGLFDPATFGRVRFHHRSVQEYLAACRLRHLRKRGMSIRKLFRLLFGERYGLSVALPSTRPISAWLALWITDICRELVLREPEVLLTLGDPQSLPLDAKVDLLRSFVAAYGKGRQQIDKRLVLAAIKDTRSGSSLAANSAWFSLFLDLSAVIAGAVVTLLLLKVLL